MFGSGPGTAHESRGLSGPVLIPTRFVWPYGGRRVFLSGSFTRCGIEMTIFTYSSCYLNDNRLSCQRSSMYHWICDMDLYLIFCMRRWLEHIPMSPMEGCPTVFQVVWNLTPGYHQVYFIHYQRYYTQFSFLKSKLLLIVLISCTIMIGRYWYG